ncbi:MAG: helix-turn-helix transcriptional regulator [Prevotella sp.]|nr:helix-turn-helix transcriptional regulator [Prevotella sp.]
MDRYKYNEEQLNQLKLTVAEKNFLDEVTSYVLTNMADGHLSVSSIADGLCIHEAKLRRRILQITGLTPSGFILTLRMRRALALLADYPANSIAQISLECGFADHSHFTHSFHRLFGISPTEYARRMPVNKDQSFTVNNSPI